MTVKPPQYATRQNYEKMVSYLRKTVNFNDLGIDSGVQIGSIPLGACILRSNVIVKTAFNAATTNVLTVGVTATATELVGSADVTEGTPAIYTGAAAGQGDVNTLAATGVSNGNVGIFAKYTQTGTAATTGQAIVVIEYIDGVDG